MVKRPTAKEVLSAIGYSIGNLMKWLRGQRTSVLRLLSIALIAIAAFYAAPHVLPMVAALPPVHISLILFSLAAGFMLFGAAAFCYVLFAFLSVIAQRDPGVRQDLRSLLAKAAHPLRRVAVPPASGEGGGVFIPHDEETAWQQEQIQALIDQGILKETDNIDDLLAKGDFDFAKIKDKARGE